MKCKCLNAKQAVVFLDKVGINNISVMCNICESIHRINKEEEK